MFTTILCSSTFTHKVSKQTNKRRESFFCTHWLIYLQSRYVEEISFFSHFLKVVKENLNYELLKYSFVCTACDFLSLIEISILVISISIANEVLGKQVMKVKKL